MPTVHSPLERKKVKSLSRVRLFATPWTVAYQAPPSMGFSRQEYWSGLPFPSPGDLPDPGIEPRSPALPAGALPSEPFVKLYVNICLFNCWIWLFYYFFALFFRKNEKIPKDWCYLLKQKPDEFYLNKTFTWNYLVHKKSQSFSSSWMIMDLILLILCLIVEGNTKWRANAWICIELKLYWSVWNEIELKMYHQRLWFNRKCDYITSFGWEWKHS